jgi:hypothetical protein
MSSQASSDPAAAGARPPGHPGGRLRAGVLRRGDVVVMASSGPTQSIAVTMAALLVPRPWPATLLFSRPSSPARRMMPEKRH